MKRLLPNRSSGFSLIELMVVISIIAVLSVIGFSVFTQVQRNARDARRREEVDAISKALEANKGVAQYVSLAPAQFAANAIPVTDPSGNFYCANSTNNPSPIPGDPSATWTNVCPASFGQVSTTVPVPAAGSTTWKVCTWLEGANAAYCKVNVQ